MRERWTRLRHLVVKDWRGVRQWAALSWLAAGGAWLLLLHPNPQELSQVQGGLTVFLPALVVALLFQGDSPLDTDAFWRTRPISAVQQFVSKLIVTGLGIALPWALMMSAPLLFRRLDMTALQLTVTLAGLAGIVAVGGASVALGALLTGHLVTGGLFSVAVYAAMVTALTLSYRIWDANLAPAGIELRLSGLWLCMLLVVPLALYVLYRTRRARLTGEVLAAGLCLGLLLNHPWGSAVGEGDGAGGPGASDLLAGRQRRSGARQRRDPRYERREDGRLREDGGEGLARRLLPRPGAIRSDGPHLRGRAAPAPGHVSHRQRGAKNQ
jgi:hypothetical protein